jgi:threonine/homoserine/homoserine lactone efflux protein
LHSLHALGSSLSLWHSVARGTHDALVSLFSILTALTVGAVSPGPSFLFVTRTSVALSRRHGIAAALGMGLGACLVTTFALVGVRAVIAQVEWLYVAFKLLGGGYLIFLGVRLWQSGKAPPANDVPGVSDPHHGLDRSFLLALATQLSNPKTLLVIGGIFAALLPAHVPLWMYLIIPPLDFTIEGSWYIFVAVAMSARAPRALYLSARNWIDRAAGCVLGALGLRLIWEARS